MKIRITTSVFVTGAMVLLIAFFLLSCGNGAIRPESPTGDDSTYTQVMSSGKIRAGYVPYPPGFIKDPNSGAVSGVFVDVLEAAASGLGLEVDWVEEVGWGTMIEGLKAGRYDMIGSPVWANSSRARLVDFTVPLYYSGIGAYVRANDHRFDNDLTLLNQPDIRISTIDGEMSQIIAQQQFPQATQSSHPQLSDNAQLLLDVVEKKADVTFVEPYIANLFLATRPNSLRNVIPDNPIRIFPNAMMINQRQDRFRRMLDVALLEQINRGYVADKLTEYGGGDNSFYQVARPYRFDLSK